MITVNDLATIGLMTILFTMFLAMFTIFGVLWYISSMVRNRISAWIDKKIAELDSRYDEDE